jgi:hypothetical protein
MPIDAPIARFMRIAHDRQQRFSPTGKHFQVATESTLSRLRDVEVARSNRVAPTLLLVRDCAIPETGSSAFG